MNSKIHTVLRVKKQINFGEHTIISEMSWSNVLWGAGSDSCVNDNFSDTFDDFSLKIFSQERIGTYDDACL